MSNETKNGKAETATEKKNDTFRAIKKHIKQLKKAKTVCEKITALKRSDAVNIIQGEIDKALNLARKIQERELKEMLED